MSHLCRADLFLHTSLAFATALLSNSWPLKKTLTCYPSSLFLCLSNLCVSPTMTLVQVSSLASHRSSWTTPFPHLSPSSTRLTISSLTSHLSLSPSSSSHGQKSPYSFPLFSLPEEQPVSILPQLISQSCFPQVDFYRCFAWFGWGRNGIHSVKSTILQSALFRSSTRIWHQLQGLWAEWKGKSHATLG